MTRCQSLFSPSLHNLRADRSTKQTLPPQGLPLQHPSLNMLTYFQTMAFSLALYFAFPFMQMTCTPLVLRGVGIRTWKAQSGERGQGHCSLGTLGSLRWSVLDPLGLLSLSQLRAQRTSAITRHHRLALQLLEVQVQTQFHNPQQSIRNRAEISMLQETWLMLGRSPQEGCHSGHGIAACSGQHSLAAVSLLRWGLSCKAIPSLSHTAHSLLPV